MSTSPTVMFPVCAAALLGRAGPTAKDSTEFVTFPVRAVALLEPWWVAWAATADRPLTLPAASVPTIPRIPRKRLRLGIPGIFSLAKISLA